MSACAGQCGFTVDSLDRVLEVVVDSVDVDTRLEKRKTLLKKRRSSGRDVDLGTRLDTHVLVHHVAAEVRVAHPQRDLVVLKLRDARLALGQPVIGREAYVVNTTVVNTTL